MVLRRLIACFEKMASNGGWMRVELEVDLVESGNESVAQ